MNNTVEDTVCCIKPTIFIPEWILSEWMWDTEGNQANEHLPVSSSLQRHLSSVNYYVYTDFILCSRTNDIYFLDLLQNCLHSYCSWLMNWLYPLCTALGAVLDLITASQAFLYTMYYVYLAKYVYDWVLLRKNLADLLQRKILADKFVDNHGTRE